MSAAIITFPAASPATAAHHRRQVTEWMIRGQMGRLQVQAQFKVTRHDDKQSICLAVIDYRGDTAAAWLKQLPLPKEATLTFPADPVCAPVKPAPPKVDASSAASAKEDPIPVKKP